MINFNNRTPNRMRKIILIPVLFASAWIGAQAQPVSEKEAILIPIRLLFEGMHQGDSSTVHRVFYNQVTLATITKDKNGKPIIRHELSVDAFLKAIGTPHTEKYNEETWGEKILVDGNFAQVWMNYAFYLGNKFSHCGVDAFHLFKNSTGTWQIFHLADTRQQEGCQVPKEIQERFK